MRLRNLLIGLTLGAAVLAPNASADQQSDFNQVHADYSGADGTVDNDIAPCRWTKDQLNNAKVYAQTFEVGLYSGFIAEVDTEIQNIDSGFCAGVAPNPGGGSQTPDADYQKVFDDWAPDKVITACKFTRQQLVSTLNVAAGIVDIDTYSPGFREAVRREIQRIDSGGCAGGGAAGKLSIKKVKFKIRKGRSPLREYVTIQNTGKAALSLAGFKLRDKSGKTIRLPRSLTLKPGRKLRVATRCLGKAKKPKRKAGKFFACKKKQIWGDKGDVVKIVDGAGKIVSQRGYKRFRSVPKF